MNERFIRNYPAVSQEDFKNLQEAKICVVGCGGLGGYLIEMLARIGIGHLTLIDGDVFEKNNLNRQLLSLESNLSRSKAVVASERVHLINSDIKVHYLHKILTKDNSIELLQQHHLVIDAVDRISTKLLIQDTCEKIDIPLIHGAINGWCAQVSTIYPGDRTLNILYEKADDTNVQSMGNPAFSPAFAASVQVSEAIKVITGKGQYLRHQIMHMDLLSNRCTIIDLR
ncbi:HesA/MoeB/ThiF family protein [Vallitalea okinawensis]|uniref:HesA/MoeB/ThiF family protein n=1 Tax=Vallitalea okinawensis TaxID=2078660 RepID=UPI000CFB8768|nr:HesA/MoeB/ThiF family protein [Vallitalea okinawensis]